MPRDIQTYSTCAPPGIARSHRQLGGLVGTLITAFYQNRFLTVAAALGFLIGIILISSPLAWAATTFLVINALVEFKYWYYNERLLCVRDRDCAIGTVISPPTASFDGDRKINLLLAPYTQEESIETLLEHIATNEEMLIDDANFNDPPFHTAAPPLPVAAQRENSLPVLRDYLRALEGEDPSDEDATAHMYRQLLVGTMDRLLLPSNVGESGQPKNFQERLYRKDQDVIPEGSSLWNAIPDDYDPTVDWEAPDASSTRTHLNPYTTRLEGLNPMFRFDLETLTPYLHCELEGNRLALLIDDLILALIAWLAAMTVLWGLLGPLAPLGALIAALAVFLLKWIYDKLAQDEGTAGEPDVDWEDPDVPDQPELEHPGDVVVAYGTCIMDTEHYQYFEIHPIRAWYIVARNSLGQEPVLVGGNVEQSELGHGNFDPGQIDAERARVICDLVSQGEEEDPGVTIERPAVALLSYGMSTRYGGGGAAGNPIDDLNPELLPAVAGTVGRALRAIPMP